MQSIPAKHPEYEVNFQEFLCSYDHIRSHSMLSYEPLIRITADAWLCVTSSGEKFQSTFYEILLSQRKGYNGWRVTMAMFMCNLVGLWMWADAH